MALELVVDVLGRSDTYSVEVLEGLVKAVADGERPDHGLLALLDARVTVVEPLYALKALQSIDGADAQKLAEAKRKLTTAIQKAIDGDVVDVFCSGSPCNGTAGRNHARATSKSVYEHPLSGLVKYVQKWHRILKKAQRGSPYVTVLENVEAGVPIPQ